MEVLGLMASTPPPRQTFDKAPGPIANRLLEAFGLYEQDNFDAGIATGLLGAFWGFVYLRRRSAIAPIVSHAGFDLLQILPFLGLR